MMGQRAGSALPPQLSHVCPAVAAMMDQALEGGKCWLSGPHRLEKLGLGRLQHLGEAGQRGQRLPEQDDALHQRGDARGRILLGRPRSGRLRGLQCNFCISNTPKAGTCILETLYAVARVFPI